MKRLAELPWFAEEWGIRDAHNLPLFKHNGDKKRSEDWYRAQARCNIDRAVECVNAMAKVKNPEKFATAANELADAASNFLKNLDTFDYEKAKERLHIAILCMREKL